MIVAVDVGGTKTLVASFHGERRISNEERFLTPHNQEDFLRELHKVLERFDIAQATALCVAVPGIVAADGTVLRCANLPWDNFPLKERLGQEVGCPIFINNDAKLAGLAETHSLETLPALSLYVTVSTGIGTGIITRGRIDPALGNSEGGHMVLQTPDGLRQWEDFASGQAIKAAFGREATEITTPSDWQQIAEHLASGFQAIIPLLQPNVIIVGGGAGASFDHFGPLLQEILRHRLSDYIELPPIVKARHPEEAVVYGCYYYATHQNLDSIA